MKIKKYILVPMLIVVFGMFSSCENKTDWSLYALEGKVKKYTENYYEPETKFGEWQKGKPQEYGNYSVTFDTGGMYNGMDFLDENNELRERLIAKIENGKVLEELRYDKDGKSVGVTKFTYLSDSNFEFISYDQDGEIIGEGTSFLENDKVIRRDYKVINKGKISIEFRTTFEYNTKGNISALYQKDEKGDTTSYTYKYIEFDEKKNWIKRLDYSQENNEIPEKVVVRTYEYYE